MVNHFRGRIHYYALWNEQDIGYWNPYGEPGGVWARCWRRLRRRFIRRIRRPK